MPDSDVGRVLDDVSGVRLQRYAARSREGCRGYSAATCRRRSAASVPKLVLAENARKTGVFPDRRLEYIPKPVDRNRE